MLCTLILYMSGGISSLKSTPNNRFFKNFLKQFYWLSDVLTDIYWEESADEIIVHISFLMFIFRNLFQALTYPNLWLYYSGFITQNICLLTDNYTLVAM